MAAGPARRHQIPHVRPPQRYPPGTARAAHREAAAPAAAAAAPLTRSTTDCVIGGVAGGLGRHLNVDPLAIRITFVILAFAGGLGILAYLACLVFVPSDDPASPQRWGVARIVGAGAARDRRVLHPHARLVLRPVDGCCSPRRRGRLPADPRSARRARAARAAPRGVALGVVLLALAVGGFVAAAAGPRSAAGSSSPASSFACGIGLVGGAFRGGARWLIAPAIVLALPLAAVAATDLDLRGTLGRAHVSTGNRRRAG